MPANSSLMAEIWALRGRLQLSIEEENITPTKLDVEVDALALAQLFAHQNLDYHPLTQDLYW